MPPAARRCAEARTLSCVPAELMFCCGASGCQTAVQRDGMFQPVAPLKYLHYKEERIIIGRIALKRLRGCYKGKMWEPLKWSSFCKLPPLISAATTSVCQTPQFSILTPLSFRVILRLSSFIHTQLLEASNLREPRRKRRIRFLGYIGGKCGATPQTLRRIFRFRFCGLAL